jgi:hypothetical protein
MTVRELAPDSSLLPGSEFNCGIRNRVGPGIRQMPNGDATGKLLV